MKKILCITLALLCLAMLCSCGKEANVTNEFKLNAVVEEVNLLRIEVEVYNSDYAFGTYWVLTSSQTLFLDSEGNTISRSGIKAGDKVEITYGGQVMMSYPPQIAARVVQIVK